MKIFKFFCRCPQLPNYLPSYCSVTSVPGNCCPTLHCDVPGLNETYRPPTEIQATPQPTSGPTVPGSIIGTPTTENPFIVGTGTQTSITGGSVLGGGFPILQQQFNSVRIKIDDIKSDFKSVFVCLIAMSLINLTFLTMVSVLMYHLYARYWFVFFCILLYIFIFPLFILAQCIFTDQKNQYHVYNEGEKWNDGCDYECECKDGKSGYYECIPFIKKSPFQVIITGSSFSINIIYTVFKYFLLNCDAYFYSNNKNTSFKLNCDAYFYSNNKNTSFKLNCDAYFYSNNKNTSFKLNCDAYFY
ncbi:hypothetical protein KUTeg_018868 [Tegillarca granosa]|uniref:Uncharacterized protein n=1 Tax=Tegillarca granosa TaxID=220873 RepID=A0ABQ9EFX1_TEGGR|nr:hypothetical protein KUTeg_018868 [Tegillarca granosa]